jgi:hypothetical protein
VIPREVAWRLLFRVNDRVAADRCVASALRRLTAIVTEGPKPYWKQTELWEVCLQSSLAPPVSEGVLLLLVAADALGTGWNVSGPVILDGELSVFEGIFDRRWGRPHVPGLHWASFSAGSSPEAGG